MTHTVRTTNQPDIEIVVDDAEYVDLQRQGLLVEQTKSGKKNTGSGSGSGGNENTGS
jgi:hypothetical protein